MTTGSFEQAELAVGDTLPPVTRDPLTITDFVRYQGASGDMNPIHHDPAFARRAGFPQPFAVGMLQAGYLGTYVTDLFGATSVRQFEVQFREQAWPGDVLRYEGTVADIADGVATLELTCTRAEAGPDTPEAGGHHLRGRAAVVLDTGD